MQVKSKVAIGFGDTEVLVTLVSGSKMEARWFVLKNRQWLNGKVTGRL